MDTAIGFDSAPSTFEMTSVTPLVFVVDDDVALRDSLGYLITNAGWRAQLFASATEFLAAPRPSCPSCAIFDVGLPDLDGLELQQQISGDRTEMPVIFITGRGDIPMTVRAMKAGAIEFLTKPFAPAVLLRAIQSALDRSRTYLHEEVTLEALRDRHRSLTPRQREVMARVVLGHLNKQIAGELGISEITVKQHRGQVMRKMRTRSVPELVMTAARLGLKTAGEDLPRRS